MLVCVTLGRKPRRLVFSRRGLCGTFVSVCESLTPPSNGNITLSTDGRTATYTCNPGFTLNGDMARVCLMDGTAWNGTAPTCGKIGFRFKFVVFFFSVMPYA